MSKTHHFRPALALLLILLLPGKALASSWDPTLLVNTESFQVIDDGDGSTNVDLRFGGDAGESLQWSGAESQFVLSDDLEVQGGMSGSSLFVTGGSEEALLATDGATGRVGIGTASPDGTLELKASGRPDLLLSAFDDAGGGQMVFQRARGTIGSPAAVEEGNGIGGIAGRGWGETDMSSNRGAITFFAAEDWTDSEQGTEIRFFVTQSGATTTLEPMRITGDGRVGVNKGDPKAQLDVAGSLSGSSLTVSTLRSCDTVDTDAQGNLVCGTDASGLTQSAADARYVNTSGDTMTGSLVIDNGGGLTASGSLATEGGVTLNKDDAGQDAVLTFGNDLGTETLRFSDTTNGFVFSDDAEIQGTLSGASLSVAGGNVTVSNTGATVWNDLGNNVDFRMEGDTAQNLFTLDASADQIGINTNAPETTLDVAGSISGATLSVGGTSDTVIGILSNTATLNFPVQGVTCGALTMTVTGAAVGDAVFIGVPNGSVGAVVAFSGWVSAANTVSIKHCGSGDPASGTFKAMVFKH